MAIKTGGRVAGTPNKRTQDIVEKLDSFKCDPIEGMVRIAQEAEKTENLSLAGQMYKELAQYVAPKRKAIELDVNNKGDWKDGLTERDLECFSDDQLQKLIYETQSAVEEFKKINEEITDGR